ncbi:MAG TPA: tetratricopeptide repeat protein [Actinomycetota bacterium]|jgi:tetratricopeptide (TPR) repeat protein|nr:tetratricopeptide repeat protein [Actinomycetota bacterium]
MPKALRPRPSGGGRSQAAVRHTLPRDVVHELNRTARAGRSNQAIARLERAVELLERGDTRGAVAEAQKAKELASRSAAVREVLGIALYGQRRWREALAELQAYRRISGRADQNHLIADAERGVGRPERAVPLAEEALAARGVPIEAKAEAVIVAASALADMGRFDQALGLLRRVKTRDEVARPEVIRVWYVLADILERAGRREEAAREFRKIMRHDAAAYDVAERLARLE